MRDGYELQFSREEFNNASSQSRFREPENQEVMDYANLCFTAMAKRAQLEENDNYPNMNFSVALLTLNNGESYLEGVHWIGLRQNVRSIGLNYVWQHKGLIGASRGHSFYASQGNIDNYGTVKKLNSEEYKFCKWFRITELSYH